MIHLNRMGPGLNAFSFEFDQKILKQLQQVCSNVIVPHILSLAPDGDHAYGVFGASDKHFYYTNSFVSSLYWVSCYNWETYHQFKNIFDRLGLAEAIKPFVDYDSNIVLYCGFVMICNQAKKESWHVDYFKGANAYTLVCPIEQVDPCHGGLVYLDGKGHVQRYQYRTGEAVIFGEGFEHSTEPFEHAEQPRVMLSLTFGTDKLKYWPVLSQTVGDNQSKFLLLPCGHQKGHCDCLEKLNQSGLEHPALEWASGYGHFTQMTILKDHPWSRTYRLHMDAGDDRYLKVLPETRKQEAPISQLLYQHFPHAVPKVLAHEPDKGWLLLADHGGSTHSKHSVDQALKSLSVLASIQVKSVNLSKLTSLLPRTDLSEILNDVCHCLCPSQTQNHSGMVLQTPASEFLGREQAQQYWAAVRHCAPLFNQWLAQSQHSSFVIEHGDFQYDNLAQLPDGGTVLCDWGDASAGPVGMSLSNPLFLARPGLAIQGALSLLQPGQAPKETFTSLPHLTFEALYQRVGFQKAYENIIDYYVNELVKQGFEDRQSILRALPGGILAGAIKWLVSWSLEADYSQSLKEVAGCWWRQTLNDLLLFAAHVMKEPPPDFIQNTAQTQDDHTPDAELSSEQVNDNFSQWLAEHGAHYPHLEIRGGEQGRGLFANKNFSQGDMLARVPLSICLYNTEQHQNEIRSLLGAFPHLYDYMPFLVRLSQLLENPNPYWKPYLDILPKDIFTLVSKYPEGLIEQLRLTVAWPDIAESAQEFKNEYQHLQAQDNELKKISLGIFYLARMLYYTRSFRGKCFGWHNDYCFIPLIDLCNHSQDSNLELRYNKKKACFEAFAERAIKAGEEISFYYGKKPNAHFLVNYGFTVSDNPYAALMLPVAKFFQDTKQHEDIRAQCLPDHLIVDTSNKVSFTTALSQLRVLAINDTEYKNDIDASAWKSLSVPVSLSSERKTLDVLNQLCLYRQSELPDVAETLKNLRSKEMCLEQFNEANVLQLIQDERSLLEQAINFVREAQALLSEQSTQVDMPPFSQNILGSWYLPQLKTIGVAKGNSTFNSHKKRNKKRKKTR